MRVLNLTALSAVLAIALGTGQLGFVFAAFFLYALLVARDASDPRYWRRLIVAEAEARRQLPDTSTLSEEALRVVVCSLRSGYRTIAIARKRLPAPLRAHVRVALSTLEDLRAHASQMIREADELHRYLGATPRETIERDIKRLKEALERAAGDARIEYDKALAIRLEQLAARERIAREHERLFASLQLIVVTVDSFPDRVHRLRLSDATEKQALLDEAHEQLARIELELTSSQRLLEGAP